MIEIDVFGKKAQIEDERWKCEDERLLRMLNLSVKAYNSFPQEYTPDRDYSIAKRVCDAWGGKITHHDQVEYDPDAVY
jgi:hypothetical protein